jgi:hypothetical protein
MESILLLSDARGVYIPQDFAQLFGDDFHYDNMQSGWLYEDAIEVCEAGPEHELYWDAWQAVLDNAEHKQHAGMVLWQDGDVFLFTEEDFNGMVEEGLI